MKIIAKMAVWAAVAGVSLPASAANLCVTPWYANPTCTERVCLNAANPVPVDTALVGTKLVVSCEADGAFKNLCVIDLARVELREGANMQHVNSNACPTMVTSSSVGLGDAFPYG